MEAKAVAPPNTAPKNKPPVPSLPPEINVINEPTTINDPPDIKRIDLFYFVCNPYNSEPMPQGNSESVPYIAHL